LIGESLESPIQNNVGENPEAGTVQRQGQIKELFVVVKSSTFFLIAPNTSAVTPSGKSSINANRKSGFQWTQDEHRTLSL